MSASAQILPIVAELESGSAAGEAGPIVVVRHAFDKLPAHPAKFVFAIAQQGSPGWKPREFLGKFPIRGPAIRTAPEAFDDFS